jgi:hypothetical protein
MLKLYKNIKKKKDMQKDLFTNKKVECDCEILYNVDFKRGTENIKLHLRCLNFFDVELNKQIYVFLFVLQFSNLEVGIVLLGVFAHSF